MLTDTTLRRLETLGILAQQGKRINGLFRLLENPTLWWQAYANLHGNKGAATPGADGSSLDGMSMEKLHRIMAELKDARYRFTPVRRVNIPKSNGKTRPLGISSGNDKLVQEVTRMILEKIYEPMFSKFSHGFRNGHSCHTALSQVKQSWTGVKWIVNMDIKGYFDNVNHEVLLTILAKRINDKRFLALIESMLKAGYMENWRFHETYSGVPQGSVVSPILANIYLNELDEFIGQIRVGFNKGKRRAIHPLYSKVRYKIDRLRKHIDEQKQMENSASVQLAMKELADLKTEQQKLPSVDPMDANYRRLVYVRYADDFLVGIIGSREEALSTKKQIADFLGNKLQLEVSEEKSGVVHASEGVRFLGYDVRTYTGNRVIKINCSGRHTTKRSVAERMQLHIPQEKLRKFCDAKGYGNYNIFYPKHRTALVHLSEAEIVQTYNAEIRGLANYYALATNAKRDLNKIHGIWRGSLLKTLAHKRRSTVTKVAKSLKQHEPEALIVSRNEERYIFPIYSVKSLRCEAIPYQKIDLVPQTWQFTLGRTELIQRLSARECEYCGSVSGPFEVHHIRKMADVRKGKELWKVVMIQRNRKTMVLCKPCHHKLHAGTLGIPSHKQAESRMS